MYDIDADDWPQGPLGESNFQPVASGRRMKTRAELATNQVTQRRNAETRAAKRVRVSSPSSSVVDV